MNSGAYFIADQAFENGFMVFAKLGLASPVVNQFSRSTEAGIGMRGLLPGRSEDVLTLGVASAGASADYATVNQSDNTETVIELSYKLIVTKDVAVVSDFQNVKNPGLSPTRSDAHVAAIRLEIEF